MMQAFTQGGVQVLQAYKGGRFALFGGVIDGEFTQLVSTELSKPEGKKRKFFLLRFS